MEERNENERIRVAVKEHYCKISSSIDPKGHILNYSFQKNILTIDQKATIEKIGSKEERAASFLNILFKEKHPETFVAFKQSLAEEYNWLHNELGGTEKIIQLAGKPEIERNEDIQLPGKPGITPNTEYIYAYSILIIYYFKKQEI